jgi:UDPglucose--hexose-1-phosphate uridylyltransferase
VADFKFLQNKINNKWVISAPRRSKRTNIENDVDICPFCPGSEIDEEELYKVSKETNGTSSLGAETKDSTASGSFVSSGSSAASNWSVRVIKNKFPFAPSHEIIIHSPDHHENWDELPFSQVELIFQTYRERFNTHKKEGSVYIFHNRGHAAGESLPHPHTQLVVIPQATKLDTTPLNSQIYKQPDQVIETEHFLIFCPETSEWPDEVWIAPKQNGGGFGLIKDSEITDLGFIISRLVQIYDIRYGHEFPFNFYISPLKNWYLRFIPRKKIIGGFELGTNIIVNTQDPFETLGFIREHFWEPDGEKIRRKHSAGYGEKV